MADSAQFDHDRIGHLLADRLLRVPEFQRSYSWEESHVSEFIADIAKARQAGSSYFLGTVVLASGNDPDRKLIVDGQQRLTTTALLFIAVRDQLRDLKRERQAAAVESTYLCDYVLEDEEDAPKLILSPSDHSFFSALLDHGEHDEVDAKASPVNRAYMQLSNYCKELAPHTEDYRRLIELVDFLDRKVQVLIAVASNLAEAYVIFETLNDRGADLTTADLLKNYLFSTAGAKEIDYAQSIWTSISSRFDKPDDFVKFLRYDYMSRHGHVTNRGLYKALQGDIGTSPKQVRDYLERLNRSLTQYLALREPDDISWSSQHVEVRDSLLALRRFQFEGSTPLLLAAFASWKHAEASKFVEIVTGWSVRALMAGRLSGGVAENAFCEAARAVSDGTVKSSDEVRPLLKDIIPDDTEFKQAFLSFGSVTTTRAKYLLARLELQQDLDTGGTGEALPDWSSKSVTVDHIFAKSSKVDKFASSDEYERFIAIRDSLQNYTLLEKRYNNSAEDCPFLEKRSMFEQSKFVLTKKLGEENDWTFEKAEERAQQLVQLAVRAWPA